MLLAFSHFERDLRSLFNYCLLSFIVLLMFNRQVSRERQEVNEYDIAKLRLLIKIKKSKGPKKDHCGTLYAIGP